MHQAVEFSARITQQLTIMTRIRALTRFPADSRVMLYPQTTIVNISSSNRELNLSIWIIFCPDRKKRPGRINPVGSSVCNISSEKDFLQAFPQPVSLIRIPAPLSHGRRSASITENHPLIFEVDVAHKGLIMRRERFEGPVIGIPCDCQQR